MITHMSDCALSGEESEVAATKPACDCFDGLQADMRAEAGRRGEPALWRALLRRADDAIQELRADRVRLTEEKAAAEREAQAAREDGRQEGRRAALQTLASACRKVLEPHDVEWLTASLGVGLAKQSKEA